MMDSGMVSNVVLAGASWKSSAAASCPARADRDDDVRLRRGGEHETLNAKAIVFSAAAGALVDGGGLTGVSTLVVGAGAIESGLTVAGEMIARARRRTPSWPAPGRGRPAGR